LAVQKGIVQANKNIKTETAKSLAK